MKRNLLAVSAVLALVSASAYAQTAGVQPSFNDAPDQTPSASTPDTSRSSASASGDNQSSTGAPANDRRSANARDNARYAKSSQGATRSDAGFGAGSEAVEPAETLNDSFHYPTSN